MEFGKSATNFGSPPTESFPNGRRNAEPGRGRGNPAGGGVRGGASRPVGEGGVGELNPAVGRPQTAWTAGPDGEGRPAATGRGPA